MIIYLFIKLGILTFLFICGYAWKWIHTSYLIRTICPLCANELWYLSPDLESMHLKQLHVFIKVSFRKSHIRDWVKYHLCVMSKHFLYGLRVPIYRSWGFIFLCGAGGGGAVPKRKLFPPLWFRMEVKKIFKNIINFE